MVYNKMRYSYSCPLHGGFEIITSVADYKPTQPCPIPKCKKKKCERDLLTDAHTLVGVADATPKTLGAMADKNASKLSDDEKAAIKERDHAPFRRTPEERAKLPDGMEWVERPKEREYWR